MCVAYVEHQIVNVIPKCFADSDYGKCWFIYLQVKYLQTSVTSSVAASALLCMYVCVCVYL